MAVVVTPREPWPSTTPGAARAETLASLAMFGLASLVCCRCGLLGGAFSCLDGLPTT